MGILLLYVLISVAFLILLFIFILKYTNRAVSLLVESKHRDAEFILSSQMAPPDWAKRLPVRMGPWIARKYAVRRLAKIINYFKHTPLVDSDYSRSLAINGLGEIRKEWQDKSWEEIYPYK